MIYIGKAERPKDIKLERERETNHHPSHDQHLAPTTPTK